MEQIFPVQTDKQKQLNENQIQMRKKTSQKDQSLIK